ncbi:MAG: cupin domain-containing protein [Alphaproteobacteria bacterium]|nr:cupin domain-containing protein [Alphaproteobacteria bacterium]MCZ6849841.1 cupin domain-containing protein [Alphaproteobacteria bacterium]
MAIEIVDVTGLAHELKSRKIIMDTRKMHAWMHYYPNPGDHDDLHCHPGDQTFLLLEGECTMSFEDGGKSVLKPGMVALIEGGTFYQLENTGDGPMVFMGTRTGPNSANQHINYDTRQDMREFNRENKRGTYGGFVSPGEGHHS